MPTRLLRRIVCAPDSFKGTLTAPAAAAAMARGIRRVVRGIHVDRCPVADGGEGSLDVLSAGIGARLETRSVTGPIGKPVRARFGLGGAWGGGAAGGTGGAGVGLVELAEASGLGLVPEPRRDPTAATTYGTGELMAAAVDAGATAMLVAVGGSATVDGGTGLAQALGATFLDRHSRPMAVPMTGGRLGEVTAWRPPPGRLPPIRVACDVTNPLLGPAGAAAVYGPQKGATPRQVAELEEGLAHLASIVGGDPAQAGAGAAGGAAWGLAAMLGGSLQRGIDLILDAIGFADRCRDADLVITGEGSLDAQTMSGKACCGVAAAARAAGVPVVAIAGRVEPGPELAATFDRIISLSDLFGEARSMESPAEVLAEAVSLVVRRP